MNFRFAAAAFAVGTTAALAPQIVIAQEYPTKPITLIVPFSPGGTTDIIGRLISAEVEQDLGQPIVVENRPGAGATVGSAVVANEEADGYTLLLANSASHGVSPAVYSELPYDPVEDFAHIALLGQVPQYLIARNGLGVETISGLIEMAEGRPGELNIGTAGEGSMGHLASEFFMMSSGVSMERIPYGGTADATQGLISGEVDIIFSNPPSARPLVDAEEVALLAVTGEEREDAYPDVPTLLESGMQDFVTYAWYGFSAPAGTPQEIVDRLNAVVLERLQDPNLQGRLAELGVSPPPALSPQEFTDFVSRNVASFSAVAQEAGIQLD